VSQHPLEFHRKSFKEWDIRNMIKKKTTHKMQSLYYIKCCAPPSTLISSFFNYLNQETKKHIQHKRHTCKIWVEVSVWCLHFSFSLFPFVLCLNFIHKMKKSWVYCVLLNHQLTQNTAKFHFTFLMHLKVKQKER
jgi:hypothetical protein